MRTQVGVAVDATFIKNLNISGTGVARTLKVGACNQLKKYIKNVFQDFWKLRPHVGVVVNAKDLNITGTGVGRASKLGTQDHLRKNIKDVSRFLGTPPTSESGDAIDFYFKTSIS